MKHLIYAVAFLSFATGAHAASFDCAKASTLVEKAICSDAKLSELDDSLMKAYKKALASSPDASGLKSQQRAWLTVRNKCVDASCLNHAYADRLNALTGNLASNAPPPNAPRSSSPTGTYKSPNGELKIQQTSEGLIKFEVFATFRTNTGEAFGDAVLKGDTAIYENRDDDCRLSFKFLPDKAIVKQDGSCSMGLNVSASDTYTMSSGNNPKFEISNSPPPSPVSLAKPEQATPASKSENDSPVEIALAKNAAKISALGFSNKWLKAPLYLRGDLVNPPSHFVIFESFLALLFENPRFSKITAIKSGKFEGILVKVKGAESTGFLFKYDGGDLFISHVVSDDQATPLETANDYLSISMMILQLAPDAIQRVK